MPRIPEPDTERVKRQASMLALFHSRRSGRPELKPSPGLCRIGGLEKHASLALKITLRFQHDDHFHSTPTEIKTADHSLVPQDLRAAGLHKNTNPKTRVVCLSIASGGLGFKPNRHHASHP